MTNNYPEWVLKYKTAGTAVVRKKDSFYLYKISSKWDKSKNRAQKITEKYLGRITPDGIVPPKVKPDVGMSMLQSITAVKEYGSVKLLQFISSDIVDNLKSVFPNDYQQLVVFAFLRIIHTATFKNMQMLYNASYLSEQYHDVKLSSKAIADFLKITGNKRTEILKFMQMFQSGKYVLFDATNIFSQSDGLDIAHMGYNADHRFEPQINLMYSFNATDKSPAYYRIIPGNIREISAFKLSVEEIGIKNTLLIADKGFSSENNILFLEQEKLNYIIPLRRNNKVIQYTGFKDENYFMFKGRPIWFHSYSIDDRKIMVYLDERLKTEETKAYLNRLEDKYEEYSLETFKIKRRQFGTFAIITNAELSEEEAYGHYKSRLEIETMFDALKNTLEADRSYMQGNQQLETWFFINHLALLLYYRLFNLLKSHGLLSKYSPQDLLLHLAQIKQVQVNNTWKITEINSKTKKLLKQLQIEEHITEKLKS